MNAFSRVIVQTPPQPYSANHLGLPGPTQVQKREERTLAHIMIETELSPND